MFIPKSLVSFLKNFQILMKTFCIRQTRKSTFFLLAQSIFWLKTVSSISIFMSSDLFFLLELMCSFIFMWVYQKPVVIKIWDIYFCSTVVHFPYELFLGKCNIFLWYIKSSILKVYFFKFKFNFRILRKIKFSKKLTGLFKIFFLLLLMKRIYNSGRIAQSFLI